VKKSSKPTPKVAEYGSAEELFRTHVPGYPEAESENDDASCASDNFAKIASSIEEDLQRRIAGKPNR
jgi:hypothetical protein